MIGDPSACVGDSTVMARPLRARRCPARSGLVQLGLADPFGELEFSPPLGNQPLRAQHHHDHEQEAEDAHLQVGQVEVEPKLAGDRVEHVRDQVVVDVGEQQRPDHDAPDRPQATEDHHREHEDREAELELPGVDQRRICAEEGARDAAERRAQRVGVQLCPHERDAHRDGGDLVFAQRDPRSPQPGVAHADSHEQRDQDQREDRVVPGSDVQLAEHADAREVRRVGAADPELAAGQRHPEDLQRRSRGARTPG